MKSISTYKNRAIKSLDGVWLKSALATFAYLTILGIFNVTMEFTFENRLFSFLAIILWPLEWGFTVMWVVLAQKKKLDFNVLFSGFENYIPVFLTMLLRTVYILLWSLLLIIPGIVKAYSYSMTYFIMKDLPGTAYNEAIETSMDIMEGKKMKLFLLDLSFIGWILLSILTLGLASLFILPYYQTTRAHFYEDLKRDYAGLDDNDEPIDKNEKFDDYKDLKIPNV